MGPVEVVLLDRIGEPSERSLVTESPMPSPFFPDAGPLIGGYITMDEGPTFMSWLVGVPPEERTSLFDRIPFKVEAEFYQHEGYQYPVFHIKAD